MGARATDQLRRVVAEQVQVPVRVVEQPVLLVDADMELAPDADLAPLHRTGLAYARGDRAEQERILDELRGAGKLEG